MWSMLTLIMRLTVTLRQPAVLPQAVFKDFEGIYPPAYQKASELIMLKRRHFLC